MLAFYNPSGHTDGGSAAVYSLFTVAPIICGFFVSGPCFVMQYRVPLLALKSYRLRREGWCFKFLSSGCPGGAQCEISLCYML